MADQTSPAPVETVNPLQAELDRLKEENLRLAKEKAEAKGLGTMSCKVVPREETTRIDPKTHKKETKVEGGNLRMYGLQRWPVTLFAGQQDRYDSPEAVRMRAKAIVENIAILHFDESTEVEARLARETVLRNAKIRLAFYAGYEEFAKNFKG